MVVTAGQKWAKVELYGQNNMGDIRRYTCASNVAITKGTLLILSDPRTAAAHATTAGGYMAGVAAAAKSATDLATTIPAWTNGVFEVTCSGTCTVGLPFKTSTVPDAVEPAANTIIGSAVGGYFLETGASDEVVNVRLRL